MGLEIIGAESLGVRSLCCLVTLGDRRRIVIDPGLALGSMRNGLRPHPVQIAAGRRIRENIVEVLQRATDVVFSHFHGDHVPLADANPYQLSIQALPPSFSSLRCWSKSARDLSGDLRKRFDDLSCLMGEHLQIAEGRLEGPLSFSEAVPHGLPESGMGTVMMTKIDMGGQTFVHASDIQLLHNETIDRIIGWQPDIVLAAGPPLYLDRLGSAERRTAWKNAIRLSQHIETVILDHHLMRSAEGAAWLEELSAAAGRRVFCAADYLRKPRRLLEAERVQLYEQMPVPEGWHRRYAEDKVNPDLYLERFVRQGSRF
ncbi:MAG: hypothetical protein JW764_09040 [Chlorobiaceae bacterium]|nr:hypothetical protein [Chlorobiaceae bacterium]